MLASALIMAAALVAGEPAGGVARRPGCHPAARQPHQRVAFVGAQQLLVQPDLWRGEPEQDRHLAIAAVGHVRRPACSGGGRGACHHVDDNITRSSSTRRTLLSPCPPAPSSSTTALVPRAPPMAARATGMSYAELCVTILADASCKLHSAARNT